jgi:hypothetical protein
MAPREDAGEARCGQLPGPDRDLGRTDRRQQLGPIWPRLVEAFPAEDAGKRRAFLQTWGPKSAPGGAPIHALTLPKPISQLGPIAAP